MEADAEEKVETEAEKSKPKIVAPTIASLDPARSNTLGGVRVTIAGEHLDEAPRR